MSRFDNEIVKEAENAWQERKLPMPTTPRQEPYDQTTNMYLDGPFGLSSQSPAPAEEMADWVANTPAERTIDVQDLDAAEDGEIIGGPGSSAVYAEGRPMYASLDDSLYSIYKASRDVRSAIETQQDFDFNGLITAAQDTTRFARTASEDQDLVYTIGNIASIVNDIEDNLVVTANYDQAYSDLQSLEGFLEDLNKYASKDEDMDEDDDECKHCHGKGCEHCEGKKKASVAARVAARNSRLAERTEWCSGLGCKIENCDGKKKPKEASFESAGNCEGIHGAGGCGVMTSKLSLNRPQRGGGLNFQCANCAKAEHGMGPGPDLQKQATNGNQETLQITDVRDLDDSGSNFTYEKTVTPDHVTNVLVPEEVNGEAAGYVNYYNDGAETGRTPQVDEDRNPFPYDGTNPALVGYQAQASVQASREKIFEALQVVERLEKLGMVQGDDRAKHIAKFEQMSDAKLAGFKASLDMLEESGARQPRSQKVASGSNRLPEMGRMTTASPVTRQDVLADDWLMTLN